MAVSTPAGRGGIGIVRLSGGRARDLAESVLRLSSPLEDARARFARVLGADGTALDEAVVTFFQAPRSYTSEDVVEIAAHGSPVVLAALLERLVAAGARLAEAGEFTQRAYLSGRLDLTQAEAVHDLIESETVRQAQVAAAQMGGAVARALAPAKEELLLLVAGLEAGVDFAEDDLDLMPAEEIVARIAGLRRTLAALAGSYGYGRLIREGVKLAIVGRPNVGKSSLFNRLLARERAIVTAQPGTTRDPVSERMALGGIPVELTDTAGLRELAARPEHEAEIEGIVRSRATMADADLVLHVVDATAITEGELGDEDKVTAAELEGRAYLLIVNKSDLADAKLTGPAAVYTSAATGSGLEELCAAILSRLANAPASDSAMITNVRQATAIGVAVEALRRAEEAAGAGVPHEFLLLELYAALGALDELTGATTAEDVLRRVFAGFCIGK